MNDWNRVVQGTEPRYSDLLHQASAFGVVTGYCISASLLLLINKWAIMKFPHPGALTALQCFTNVIGVLLCGQLNLIERDPLNLVTMSSELPLHSNVDTFNVFRSAVPIFVAIRETLFLNQPWPSLKTWIIMTGNNFTGTLGLLDLFVWWESCIISPQARNRKMYKKINRKNRLMDKETTRERGSS
ncbi:hypothetical protein Bca52824_014311 [Brassica carinata]|uniref:Uncharacterized protein n=1 Tax=Brassica carinata TaxID=52824 RepID=A0A8X8B4B3_BRACI|nr:hypothetical protein Bca52824_014311 [Brassica carinata]